MTRAALIAWVAAAVAAIAALLDVAIRPTHWDRTLAVALVVAVLAASFAMIQRRRSADS